MSNRRDLQPGPVVAAAHADAILTMHQVKALAHQILLRPDLAEERAQMILETLEDYTPAGHRILGSGPGTRPRYGVTPRRLSA